MTHLARRASCRSLGHTHWPVPLPKIVSAMAPGWEEAGVTPVRSKHQHEAQQGSPGQRLAQPHQSSPGDAVPSKHDGGDLPASHSLEAD